MNRIVITDHSTISENEREAALRWALLLLDGARNGNAAAENVLVSAFRTHGPRNQQQSKAA